MENIEDELNTLFNHNIYNDYPKTDSEKTYNIQNYLDELFITNTVIYSADSIQNSETYDVDDNEAYNIITYKNGYKEIYEEYTNYDGTKKITRIKCNRLFINKILKQHDEYIHSLRYEDWPHTYWQTNDDYVDILNSRVKTPYEGINGRYYEQRRQI